MIERSINRSWFLNPKPPILNLTNKELDLFFFKYLNEL